MAEGNCGNSKNSEFRIEVIFPRMSKIKGFFVNSSSNWEKHLCQLGIGLLRQYHLIAPSRKDASSQDCRSLSCKNSGDKNAEQAFLWLSCLWKKNCHGTWHEPLNKPNLNQVTISPPLVFPGRPAPILHWLIDGVALRDKSRSVVTTRKDRTRDKQMGGEVIEKSCGVAAAVTVWIGVFVAF